MKICVHSARGGRRRATARAGARAALVLWVALAAAAAAAGQPSLPAADVRIVVDVSASMGRTDPDNVRSEAVGLLLRMLPEDGRAGVWTYGQYVNMLVKYDTSNALWKETAAMRTADLASVGRRSNLLEAVDRASWDRHREHAGPAHLVLLTDGKLDISDEADANAAQRKRLLTQVAPELAASGFKVHTLALSDQADEDLLGQLSAITGGYHGRIATPEELPEGLVSVLGWVAAPALLDIADGGTFRVAPGTRSLTVLRFPDAEEAPTALVTPSGERLTRKTPRDRVRWHVGSTFELATLNDPEPGLWRFQGGRDKVSVRAYTDLAVRYLDLPGTVFPGELRSFEFAMTSGGDPVTDPAFLKLLQVSAHLQGPDGEVPLVVEPAESGRFSVNLLGLRGKGDYVLVTRVQGPTFQQTLSLPFVLDNPLSVEVHPAGDGFALWVHAAAAGLDHHSLRLAALVKRPPAAAKLFPLESMPAGMWKLTVPGARGLVEVTLDLQGKYLNGREFSLRTEPIRVVLPVSEVQYVNLDLQGRPLLSSLPPTESPAAPEAADQPSAAPPPGQVPLPVPMPATPAAASEVPGWLMAAAVVVNLGLLGVLWWLLGRRGAGSRDLRPVLSRLRALAGGEAGAEDEAPAAAAS